MRAGHRSGHPFGRFLASFVGESVLTLALLVGLVALAQLVIRWMELFDADDED